MLTQLNPSVPVVVVENKLGMPTGNGLAAFLIDYGQEHNVLWGIIMDKTGEVWWVQNSLIRVQTNRSFGRVISSMAPLNANDRPESTTP
jgi:hypothetical protein